MHFAMVYVHNQGSIFSSILVMATAILAIIAFCLDWLLGEPRRFHPLIGFGNLVRGLEGKIYGDTSDTPRQRKLRGAIAVTILVLPISAFTVFLTSLPYIGMPVSILLLYLAIGHKSLHEHAEPVAAAMRNDNLTDARKLAARIVSRDSDSLDVAGATTESVLENGCDSVFATLFWFMIAGAPAAVLHRLVNTLDAMWGYRNQKYQDFGWAAARLDDLVNYLPARLTAVTYAIQVIDFHELKKWTPTRKIFARTKLALTCWRDQGTVWKSPNAGPVMAAGAGALGITIGGPACYQGEWHTRIQLGEGHNPTGRDIDRALLLVRNGVIVWLGISLFIAGCFELLKVTQ